MAEIPGQIEPLTDERRLTTPLWYEWLLSLQRTLIGSWNTGFATDVVTDTGGPPSFTATCRYHKIGKTVSIQFNITITALNGGGGALYMTLPFASAAYGMLTGREIAISGKTLTCTLVPNDIYGAIFYYDNSVPLVVGAIIVLSGTYEAV